jgi:hypothetical protein
MIPVPNTAGMRAGLISTARPLCLLVYVFLVCFTMAQILRTWVPLLGNEMNLRRDTGSENDVVGDNAAGDVE